ncbi:hypothetical protein [Gandjariella thermophila]|uniref:Uncharacterized protein n=1 Tax=Gandjariella thermophila TaxID=1931992 RepID=A0A4D4J5T1_9PSEU|nr:hypothetical protein [Gandjariella thermophila]GDY29949.1 hypothetical protein GTS_15820 [Gandjariella thermophila]
MINTEVVAAADAPRSRRVVTLAAVLGLLVAVLFGAALFGASPAYASTTPAAPSATATGHASNTATRHAVATRTLLPDRDVLVGGLAGIAMLGTAGAVLWYTARSRYLYH